MTIYFALSTGGFYDTSIYKGELPSDAGEVSAEEAAELRAGQSVGKVIVTGAAGSLELQDPPPAPAVVPAFVSRFQARAALYNAGHFSEIEDFMALPSTPMLMRLAWQDAQTFDRDSATVAALAGVLGLTDADLDALFIAAAEIRG